MELGDKATWPPSRDQEPVTGGPTHNRLAHSHMESTHTTRGQLKRGCTLYNCRSGFCTLIYGFFIDFICKFEDFWPFLGDIGSFLGQILGGSWDMVTNFRYI
jgi:hypothetical protein